MYGHIQAEARCTKIGGKWWKFARLLLEIIKGCPVVFVPTEISKLEIIKYSDREFGYKFTLTNNRQKPVLKLKLKPK